MSTADTPIVLWKASDLRQVIRQEVAEAVAKALAEQNQARSAPVGALTKAQAAAFLNCKKTRFNELLREHPELDAMAVTLKVTSNGRKYRRWTPESLKAWMERQSVLDEAA